MPKTKKRIHSDAFKVQVVKEVLNTGTIRPIANKHDINDTLLRRWSLDPRYGGDPNFTADGTSRPGLPPGIPAPRMVATDGRRVWGDDAKRKIVALFKQSGLPLKTFGSQAGIWDSQLRKWAQDPRYNADVNDSGRSASLPVTAKKTIRHKKPLLATGFACPHCGGPISTEGMK